jgi:hypothetical protein
MDERVSRVFFVFFFSFFSVALSVGLASGRRVSGGLSVAVLGCSGRRWRCVKSSSTLGFASRLGNEKILSRQGLCVPTLLYDRTFESRLPDSHVTGEKMQAQRLPISAILKTAC